MNNEQKRDLCLAWMKEDSESEVIGVLSSAGLWENCRVWRLYGDRENNFSTIGNQQNRPDAALVEKLVNSVDARLMHECLAAGINPESPAAPFETQSPDSSMRDVRPAAFLADNTEQIAGLRTEAEWVIKSCRNR